MRHATLFRHKSRGTRQYYYGDYCYWAHYPWARRVVQDCIPEMVEDEFQFDTLKVCAFACAVVNAKSAHLHNYMSSCALLLLTGDGKAENGF